MTTELTVTLLVAIGICGAASWIYFFRRFCRMLREGYGETYQKAITVSEADKPSSLFISGGESFALLYFLLSGGYKGTEDNTFIRFGSRLRLALVSEVLFLAVLIGAFISSSTPRSCPLPPM